MSEGIVRKCSCLENPRDGGACWAAIYGVAQSRTRLERLSSSSMTNFPSILDSWPSPRHAPSIFILLPSSRSPVYITPTTGQNINISNCPEHSLSKHWLYDAWSMSQAWGKGPLFNSICNYDSIRACAGMPALCFKKLLAIMFFPSKGAQGHQNPWEEHV